MAPLAKGPVTIAMNLVKKVRLMAIIRSYRDKIPLPRDTLYLTCRYLGKVP